MLAQFDEILTANKSDWPPRGVDVTRPTAVLVIRPNGHREGGPFHPKSGPFHLERDLVPLEHLIRHAVDALLRRLREIRGTLDVPPRDTPRT
ncbi:MAG: hypothetical protein QOE57_2307 [Acidimicrobiaceae bacterium]|jgi:hypothetical protein|nr:hypothetical protein [Acidimicrobiaceae bacterium]